MRIAGPIITLACGIAVLIGVFLLWMSAPIGGFTFLFSGWDYLTGAGVAESVDILLVLIGGILMIACSLPAFILSLFTKRAKGAVRALDIVASVGAALAVFGCLWFIIPAASDIEFVGYGFYISIAAAVAGLVFGIAASATTKVG